MSVDFTGQRLGHYTVGEVIGRGGMSVVYRAVDERLQRAVALKVMSGRLSIDAESRSRFTEEARSASALDHVNVVPLYDCGEIDGALFIAMRLVDGTDLARELASGPMPVGRVLDLLGQVGAALDMLHERGLVHLDVKPANVLMTTNESVGHEHVYLTDFGLTRRGTTGHRTATGDFLGSPTYASPEHLRGDEVLPSSDVYALTCMLFAAIAGRAPYLGDVRTVITGHLTGVVPSLSALSGLPPAVDRVIGRGMAADPAGRFGTSSELLSAIRRAMVIAAPEPAAVNEPAAADESAAVDESAAARPDAARPAAARPAVAQVRPSQFGPDPSGRPGPTGRRPISHRLVRRPAPRWPWFALGSSLVLVAAVVVFVITRSSWSAAPPVGSVDAPPAGVGPTRTTTAAPDVARSRHRRSARVDVLALATGECQYEIGTRAT